MKRGIWIGAAILVAAAAAVPLWLSLDGGSRNQAALAETTETKAINCDGVRDAEACADLNRLVADLGTQLSEIDRRQAMVEELQAEIERNGLYLAGTKGDLPPDHALELKAALEQSANFALVSNLQSDLHRRLMAIIANLRG
jgi:hypothetical protein